jgi:CheY-like chemotaxis protein
MVSSEPGKGAVVSVLFPAAMARSETSPAEKVSSAPPVPPSPALSGTVLVADDEPSVRTTMELLLKRMGLRVISADDGQRAVELFQQHAAEITFVLIDLTMPKLDGRKALTEMRRIRPDVKVVLSSGYDSDDLTRRFGKDGFDAYIQKPCDIETFKAVIERMCAAAAGPGAATVVANSGT